MKNVYISLLIAGTISHIHSMEMSSNLELINFTFGNRKFTGNFYLKGSILPDGNSFSLGSIVKNGYFNTDLSNFSFKGCLLENIDFKGSNLTNANFRNAKLHNVILDFATVINADFTESIGLTPDQIQDVVSRGALYKNYITII